MKNGQWQKSENQNVDALYYLVRALDLLAAPAGRNLSAEWQEFLRGCRVRSGGFGNLPGDPGDIEHTYCASHLLLILGAGTSDLVDGWAEECMRPDGWIVWSPTEPRYSHATLYWGSHLALILNIHRQWEATLPLISKTQNPDGGFGLNGSSLWHVYCAVSSRLITEIMLGRRMRTDLVVE